MMMSRRSVLLGLLAGAALPRLAVSADSGVVDALIAKAALDGEVAFLVSDAKTGEVLASRHPDAPLPPASTLKLITALYALETLGATHHFRTSVYRDGDALVLAGGGDPELDSDTLALLARSAVEAEKASGRPAPTRLLVWGGALPRIDQISQDQAVYLPYNPTVSGMILNFNRVHLGWRRGESGYAMSLEARGRKQSPRAYTIAISAADRGHPLFTYDGEGKNEGWTIARRAMGKSGSRWLPVRRPELYAGDVFQTLCRAEGMPLPNPEITMTPPAGIQLASFEGAALMDVLTGMLEYSNNLTAEVVGLAASGQPDLQSSAAKMQEWLRAQGVEGDYRFADHSGLSAESHLTARVLTDTINRFGARQPLRGMLKNIALRDVKGKEVASTIKVAAKTGTLNFASNLTGYAQDGEGRLLSFAILTVDEPRRAAALGQELPEGVIGWTKRSKALQQGLIENWVAEYAPAPVAVSAEATGG